MEKYIYNEHNGLWYELQGDYYIPRLVLDEENTKPIGMWGRKYLRYIKEHRPVIYTALLLSGKLNSHLAEIDNRATEMFDQLISRNEDNLLATMTDTQKELFTKYADCVREHQVMAENLLFQNSFCLGAGIMLEVMRE